ncbi:hypothetical protein GCM10009530_75340 [Microbispora corallina]|uniref:BlaI/MecI/CopY family transcriptional regulator n=1 Tax=Microbispora corallina TaxID=83302 RepID=A0ABQ4G812_9ACTN|nr:BlaI/MecI/CopY family transcriptional regulator [Microbispora corallina]GIH43162.1 hypothetical protein Mco01_61620 [Microbispora corallina]
MADSQQRQPGGAPQRRGPSRRSPGALEQEILACLGAADRPLTPGEVLAEMGGELAYTTVMTTLARLYKRGLAEREPSGRAYAYCLASDATAAQSMAVAAKMRRLLVQGGDPAGVLAHFVADLGPEEEQILTQLLRDLEAGRHGTSDPQDGENATAAHAAGTGTPGHNPSRRRAGTQTEEDADSPDGRPLQAGE